MNIKQLALVLGATVALVGGGMGAVACSSSSSGGNGSGSSSGGSGSSSGSTMDSSAGNDTGTNEEAGESDAGMGVDCGKIPTLHSAEAGTIFCGYPPGDGGSAIECTSGGGEAGASYCCLGGSLGGGQYAPQICAPTAAGCVADGDPDAGKGGVAIQCNQLGDCPGNGAPGATACCLQGATLQDMMASCGYDKAVSGTAVICEGTGGGAATACAGGEVQVCVSDSDCPSGKTCKPGKWKVFQMGFCL